MYTSLSANDSDDFDLGSKAFSEKEIIDYARKNDPLPFHLSEEAAQKSFFGKLVCSGGQAFNFFYVNRWIPLFGDSVVGGLGVDKWEFLSPIGKDEPIQAKCKIVLIRESKQHPGLLIVNWKLEFRNNSGSLVQSLLLKVLHKK